ncbi:MAG: GNAT family N-acetyltransferase [Gaiellaceae bacterium]
MDGLSVTELGDGELLLRPLGLDDVPRVTEICQDPEISRWTRVPDSYTVDHARTWIEHSARAWDKDEASFAVTEVVTGRLVGAIGLHLQEHFAMQASIGYWVAKDARGRGVATRALRLVARWALEDLGLPRVQLVTDPDNLASQRVAEKAGFRREGVLRQYVQRSGRRGDCVIFSLLPGELDDGERG